MSLHGDEDIARTLYLYLLSVFTVKSDQVAVVEFCRKVKMLLNPVVPPTSEV